MKRTAEVDVCVVGLGAVGAFVAYGAASAGSRVLALEAGSARPNSEVVMDELLSSIIRNSWGAEKFNQELPTWRLSSNSPRRPMRLMQRMANGVGGSSLVYAGTSLRFHQDDFQVRSATLARYGPSALPEGTEVNDWPLTYEDLEPYYDRVEKVLGVSGQAGNISGTLVAGGNPFEGPRRHPYPLPPLRTSGMGQLFYDAACQLGYHPFPNAAAILSEPYQGRPACTYCSYCTQMGCHIGAKGNTAITVLPQTLETGNLEVRTGCRVVRIAVDDGGEVVGVEYEGDEGRIMQPAGTVVLASYAFENVRLLLLSTSRAFPQGIGNEYGQVGRGYMTHQRCTAFGLFPGRHLHRFMGPFAQHVSIDDLNADNFDHSGLGFIRGGRIFIANQHTPIVASAAIPPDVRRWGRDFKAFLVRNFDSVAQINASPEVLPHESNFLDLDPEVRDPLGLPVVRITFDLQENEKRQIQYLQDRVCDLMAKMGAEQVWRSGIDPQAISSHDAGGTRMGTDRARSVVDSFGRVHGVPRLFIAGGSTFPTHSGMNSTLTMQALGLRTGLHIGGRSI